MSLQDRIARILKYSGEEWSVEDFLQMVEEKKIFLFNVEGVLIIAGVQQFPQKKVFHIWGTEGEGAIEKMPILVSWAKEAARSLECTELRCQGRKGWERALLQHGAKVLYTTLVMEP